MPDDDFDRRLPPNARPAIRGMVEAANIVRTRLLNRLLPPIDGGSEPTRCFQLSGHSEPETFQAAKTKLSGMQLSISDRAHLEFSQ